MKKIILYALFLTSFVSPISLSAQSANVADLQALLLQLQQQVEALQRDLAQAQQQTYFTQALYRGVQNAEVSALQTYLSQFPELYPEGIVSGYYGALTEKAVMRFQEKYGIDPIGVVGPQTRAKLNELTAPRPETVNTALPQETSGQMQTNLETSTSTIVTSGLQDYYTPGRPDYDLDKIATYTQQLVNEERQKNGLAPLLWNDSLAKMARMHSEDQARDNVAITNPNLLCHYPIIRHEGLSFGYSLTDRLINQGISYSYAGENIAILPAIKNSTYRYTIDNPPAECPIVPRFEPGLGIKEERLALYQEILDKSLTAVSQIKPVDWVDRTWYTGDELAQIAVEEWMKSEGHRKNILTPEFTEGGIGVVRVNDYLIITHNFLRP